MDLGDHHQQCGGCHTDPPMICPVILELHQQHPEELETAMLLATSFGKGMTMQQAIQHASTADVRRGSSIPVVATFVQRFAGHAGSFPILHVLSNFRKGHC